MPGFQQYIRIANRKLYKIFSFWYGNKGSYFDIRDLTTDRAMNLQVNDWGPDQKQAPDRIVDLDRGDFSELHGNYSAGVFYCRTWVPINNYNPG